MTALKEFDRLEASGLWRESPDSQRRNVVVSLGDNSLTILDTKSQQALAHWSLAAVERSNGTGLPAVYHPDGDPGETLEIAEDEAQMIAGIDSLLRDIERRRPHPGKLRWLLGSGVTAALVAGAVFWLPDALMEYTARALPFAKRQEIGQAALDHMSRVTGQACMTAEAAAPLNHLATRTFEGRAGQIVIVPTGKAAATHLPGQIIILNRSVVEDHEDPDVAAGYVLAERARAQVSDPLADLIQQAGFFNSLRLLATGNLSDAALRAYAEDRIAQDAPKIDPTVLLALFQATQIRSTAYAYAVDVTGETTLSLIEGDPLRSGAGPVVLSDADWVRLQGICGG
ncbi:MAG: hypothetical protein N4A61_07385 [Pelagimonas sp.]|jgi:hypothetical protein|nr:hypothetical protein [Pelagimonas sp.]